MRDLKKKIKTGVEDVKLYWNKPPLEKRQRKKNGMRKRCVWNAKRQDPKNDLTALQIFSFRVDQKRRSLHFVFFDPLKS